MRSLLARHGAWLGGSVIVGVILLLIGLLVPVLGSPADERVAIGFFINVIIVLGLQSFMGNSGIMNFGFAAYLGVGAYATAILVTPTLLKATNIPNAPFGLADVEVPFWVGVALAVLLAALVGLIAGIPLMRQEGIPAAVASLAVLIIVHVVLTNWIDLTRGPRAFFGIPVRTTLMLSMTLAILTAIGVRAFKESPIGLQLRASREDSVAAECMGVNVHRVRLIAWVLSSALIGLGGVLTAHLVGTINPDAFYFRVSFLIFAMMLLGGQGSASGPVLGAIVVTVGFEVTRNFSEGPVFLGVDFPQMFGLPQFFLGVLIIVVMKFRPVGLMGDNEVDDYVVSGWRRWRARGTAVGESGAASAEPGSMAADDPPLAARSSDGRTG